MTRSAPLPRPLVTALGLALLATVVGCASPPPAGTATLAIRSEWVDQRPGEQLGGFAFFGRLTGAEGPGEEFEITNDTAFEIPAGSWLVETWVRQVSDAIEMREVPGGTPQMIRSFGEIMVQCRTEIAVADGDAVELVLRATAGGCEVAPATPA